jgi:hypothetical protein
MSIFKTPQDKRRKNRGWWLKRFGKTIEDREQMYIEQGGTCKVCDMPITENGKNADSAHWDHCHDCNMPRGLVCKRCNAILGMIEKDSKTFMKIFMFHVEHVCDTHCVLR